ncbi:MAG: amidophosphoribosyltransferase [Acidobacteriota bacterium]
MARGLKHCCGVFGIIGHSEAGRMSYLGLYALQHRGQESAGIATADRGAMFVERGMGHVAEVFDSEHLDRLPGRAAIGHVRYSTAGESNLRNAQPVRIDSRNGSIALGHNGNLVNAAALRQELEADGAIFTSSSDTEVMMHLFARSDCNGALNALVDALDRVQGAFTVTALTDRTLIGARDPLGFRPLSIGLLEGAWVLASESCAFDLIGARTVRDLAAGEIVAIGEEAVGNDETLEAVRAGPGATAPGYRSLQPWCRRPTQQCIFEQVYFARPDSVLFGASVLEARKRMGEILAKEAPADADVVVPVPDGGVYAGLGYAAESGLSFEMALIRNHYVGRTFIEPRQSIRHFGVKVKLNPVRSLIEGRRVVLVDDSIVRGTTSGKIVEMMRSVGAAAVHVRVSSPPYISPCYYGIDTPRREELVGANHSLEEICRKIGADSLAYLSLEGLQRAVSMGEKHYCTACFTGDYPTSLGDELEHQMELFTPVGAGPACGGAASMK